VVEDIERLLAKHANDLVAKISVANKSDVKLEVHGVLKTELQPLQSNVKDILKEIRSVSARIDVINTKLDSNKIELNTKLDGIKAKLIPKIENVKAELGARLDRIRAEYAEKIEKRGVGLDERINSVNSRTALFGTLLGLIFAGFKVVQCSTNGWNAFGPTQVGSYIF
jgi:hypothetical protein